MVSIKHWTYLSNFICEFNILSCNRNIDRSPNKNVKVIHFWVFLFQNKTWILDTEQGRTLTFQKGQVRGLTSKKVLFHSLERSTIDALLSKPFRGHFMSTQCTFVLQLCNYKLLHVNLFKPHPEIKNWIICIIPTWKNCYLFVLTAKGKYNDDVTTHLF